ncbi:MAG TPA: pyridoxal-dependent decarboxylase [Oceanipulchritudo sp.]|nr:pyridoxal-dependent decarboxylase [Oceanipulchritudo sp.]
MTQDTDLLKRLFAQLEAYFQARNSGPLVEYKAPDELKKLLELDTPGSEGDWERIFAWIQQYLDHGVKTSQPTFLNRLWSGANLPSILAEMVVAISNTSSDSYESAPVSILYEKYMIQQMIELVGFSQAEGQMTTGSSNANMVALMCARNRAGTGVKEDGLFRQRRLVAFVNVDAHYSMDKAANILGLGTENLVKVATNARGEMDPEALQEAIEYAIGEGSVPFFVGLTAGTTVRGAFDPIPEVLELREQYGFWLHVDGAWGGAAIMSDLLRERFMPRLKEVDSFTFDFHKMLGSALMCNVLLLNKSTHTLGTVLAAGDTSYLFRDENKNEVLDLGSVSLQCGRRVDGLKWFLDWKFYGKAGFGKRVEDYLDLCAYAEECLLQVPELELVAPRVSFNLCFRYKVPDEFSDTFNKRLRNTLYQRGLWMVGLATVEGRLCMRLVISNTQVTRDHLKRFFEQVVEVGHELDTEEDSASPTDMCCQD